MSTATNILITMAGDGDRFEVRGRTLFSWALESLRNFLATNGEVVFATRPEDDPRTFLAREAEALGIRQYTVAPIDHETDGQATTARLAGRELRDRTAPVIIYNLDTFVEPEFLRPIDVRGQGWIPCFSGQGDAWSFARATVGGRVEEVAEKRRISPHAMVGLYWFRSFELYDEIYRAHFPSGTGAGERHIPSMYNTLISRDGGVYLGLVPPKAVHPLGAPLRISGSSLEQLVDPVEIVLESEHDRAELFEEVGRAGEMNPKFTGLQLDAGGQIGKSAA